MSCVEFHGKDVFLPTRAHAPDVCFVNENIEVCWVVDEFLEDRDSVG